MKKIIKKALNCPQTTVDRRQWTVVGGLLTLILLFIACSCTQKKNLAIQVKYTCPMHPEIIKDKPGTCPICFMDLVKVGDSAGADGLIRLNESQIKLANITTAPALKKEMEIKTILTGKIVVNEEYTEIISSRAQGRIEKLFFKEVGQRVTQNEPLYEIYSEQLLTLQQEYLLALRQVEELKEKRYQSFLAASEKKLLLFGMNKDQVAQLAKKRTINSRVTFLAPASGVIARIDVSEGQFVSEGSALYRVEKLDKVWVEAELYSGEASLVKMGDPVKVIINGFENNPIPGRIIFLSPEYRQGNQIITLRVEILNTEKKFIPGMQANVVVTHPGKNALVLPVDAVIRDGLGSRIWVQMEDGSFDMHSVTTGDESADEIEVTGGLEEKENVVVTGAYLLYSELVLKKGLNQHRHNL